MHPHNFLIFDIETIPDIDGIRLLNELSPDMFDKDVAQFAFDKQKEKTGSNFLPQYLHKIICLSAVLRTPQSFSVFSLYSPTQSEAEIVDRFFKGIERYMPQIVSWNGSGFDLPVLNYRAMKHGIAAARFWETGERFNDFRWNNYISRYHMRHLDLMDTLALYNGKSNAPLDKLAKLLGFPGKLGVDGNEVWPLWQEGDAESIRQYCETDVLNTYLLFLRFRRLRGELTASMEASEWALIQQDLKAKIEKDADNNLHWEEFLDAWNLKESETAQ